MGAPIAKPGDALEKAVDTGNKFQERNADYIIKTY